MGLSVSQKTFSRQFALKQGSQPLEPSKFLSNNLSPSFKDLNIFKNHQRKQLDILQSQRSLLTQQAAQSKNILNQSPFKLQRPQPDIYHTPKRISINNSLSPPIYNLELKEGQKLQFFRTTDQPRKNMVLNQHDKENYLTSHIHSSKQDVMRVLQKHDELRNKVTDFINYINHSNVLIVCHSKKEVNESAIPLLTCASINYSTCNSSYTRQQTNTYQPQSKAMRSGQRELNIHFSPQTQRSLRQSSPLTSSKGSRPEVSQNSLLHKFEYISNNLGLHEDNRRNNLESLEQSKSSDLEFSYQWNIRSCQNKAGILSELQEQDFSPQPSAEMPAEINDDYFVKINSFTFQNSVEEGDGFSALDTYKLNQIQEQSDETEGEQRPQYFNKQTPSLQDLQIASTESTKKEFPCFYNQKIRKSVDVIERNIKAKEYSYTSSNNDTYSSQQQGKQTFDTYYMNYVEEEVSGLEMDIGEIQMFLRKVKSAKCKLKNSLKDLYKTININHNSSRDSEYQRASTTPYTYPTLTNQEDKKSNPTITSEVFSEAFSLSSQHTLQTLYPIETGRMQDWIVHVSQDLENIDRLRTMMLTAIKDMKMHGTANTNSLEKLKGMKDKIHNHFWNVENAVRVINEEYASKQSDNTCRTFSSNNTIGNNNERKFDTQNFTEEQSFENYYNQTKWNKHQVAKQFQTQTNQVFEYDEEDESSQC